jgi:microcystin-dependent protein
MALTKFNTKYGVGVSDTINPTPYDFIPTGTMMYWPAAITQSASAGVITTTAPDGWLLCNGDVVLKTGYSNLNALFSLVSYPYGSATSTFTLPDFRSRALVHGTFPTINVGAETQTLLDANITGHSHTLNTHSHTGVNGHTHTVVDHSHTSTDHTHANSHYHTSSSTGGAHTHSYYSNAESSSVAGLNRNNTAVNATTFITHDAGGGVHTHGMNNQTTTLGFSNSSTSSGATTTAYAGPNQDSSGPTPANTDYNGTTSRDNFTLMQPFLTMNLIIKV